jgi:diguanylate cyclase (GGDEF)-like protein/PAS domain S-box-containing protein
LDTQGEEIKERERVEKERNQLIASLRKSEALLAEAQRVAHLGIWEFEVLTGKISWTQEKLRIFGFDPTQDEPTFAELINLIYPDDRASFQQAVSRALTEGIPYELDFRIVQPNSKIRHIDCRGEPVFDEQGQVIKLLGTVLDITERKQTEETLHQSLTKNRVLLDAIPDMMFRCHVDGTYLEFKPAKYLKTLVPPSEFLGKKMQDILPPKLAQRMLQAQEQAIVSGETQVLEYQLTVDEQLHDYEVRIVAYGSDEIIALVRDITSRKWAESQLRQNALYDALTGLPNRALFMERLKYALELALQQENYLFAVLFIDLDRFKVINDSLGHLKGDKFLLAVANRIKVCVRSQDTAARVGGDEFTILLEGILNASDAIQVAQRIQQELALPFDLGGQEVFTSASIGIALSSTVDYDQPEDVIRDADTAMYRAKTQGKARYELFNPEMYASAVARLQLENDLRRAIEREEFRVFYQPIVSLTSGFVVSFEALVRWQHPKRGLLSPADFIPLAEETGLIVSIGYWVLYEATRQMQTWQVSHCSHSLEKISVNLSVKQFSQPDLTEQIRQILSETGLAPTSLVLEITESAIMENGAQATAILFQLRDLGIELSIDDFGTGYSSLGRLNSLPISILKIDRSFISPINASSKNLEIIEIIITLAHKLDVSAIAEGVETKQQLALLKKLNCESVQGYFFSEPLDSLAATALITANPQW